MELLNFDPEKCDESVFINCHMKMEYMHLFMNVVLQIFSKSPV